MLFLDYLRMTYYGLVLLLDLIFHLGNSFDILIIAKEGHFFILFSYSMREIPHKI